jgi:hypothetical protein
LRPLEGREALCGGEPQALDDLGLVDIRRGWLGGQTPARCSQGTFQRGDGRVRVGPLEPRYGGLRQSKTSGELRLGEACVKASRAKEGIGGHMQDYNGYVISQICDNAQYP